MKTAIYSRFSDMVSELGIKKTAEFAQKKGFSAVEFIDIQGAPYSVPNKEAAKEYRTALDAYGLKVACYSVGINLIRPGVPEYDSGAAVEALRHAAEMAAILGSPFLHHTLIITLNAGALDILPYEKAKEKLLPLTLQVADIANSLGITALYEPQGFYINGKDNFSDFYQAVKSSGKKVGVCGDLGNPLFRDWYPVDFIKTMAYEIKHVHIKDYKLFAPNEADGIKYRSKDGIGLLPVPIGKGDVDIYSCLDLLSQSGYNGYLSLESEYTGDYGNEMTADLDYLSSLDIL